MPNDLTPTDPARFGLTSFADLLPARDDILGEDPRSFDQFHEAMVLTLVPMTPYEAIVAENLIAIEWELLQHRRMRDAGLRAEIRRAIEKAVCARAFSAVEAALDEEWDKHEADGGTEDDWEPSIIYDADAATELGQDLAQKAVSSNPEEFAAATEEIAEMGLDVVDLMAEAYRSAEDAVRHHEQEMPQLERRRREVKRDFDALQRARPIEATADADVIDG